MLNKISNVWRFGPRRLGSGPHFEKLLNVQRSVSKRLKILNVWQSGLERLKNLQRGMGPNVLKTIQMFGRALPKLQKVQTLASDPHFLNNH